ncbi:MAG TPA: UBP-type zinc finger domain-containing protein [Candidatus Cybelea sp.]
MAKNKWWFHLRRCAQCGHIGCCDQSLGKHATAHYNETHHPIIASFEPGETWFYSYATGEFMNGPRIAPPRSHPEDQPVPGPRGRVPTNWQALLS